MSIASEADTPLQLQVNARAIGEGLEMAFQVHPSEKTRVSSDRLWGFGV